MPSDESKGSQLDAIGSLAQRQLDNTSGTVWSAQPASPKELRLSKSGSNSSTRAGYAAATNT